MYLKQWEGRGLRIKNPKRIIEISCETHPEDVGEKEPRRRPRHAVEVHNRVNDCAPERHKDEEREVRSMCSEEHRRPDGVQEKLHGKDRDDIFFLKIADPKTFRPFVPWLLTIRMHKCPNHPPFIFPNQKKRYSHQEVEHCPHGSKNPRWGIEGRLHQPRIPAGRNRGRSKNCACNTCNFAHHHRDNTFKNIACFHTPIIPW